MKTMRGFIIAMLILFACMMTIETLAPKHFNWDATYAHASDEPFACALIDSVMAASLPQGYTTTSLTFSQLEKTIPDHERHTYLVVAEDEPFSSTDELAMLHMLKRGDNVIVASGTWRSDTIEQVLNISILHYNYLSPWALRNDYFNQTVDTLTWCDTSLGYERRQWYVPDDFCNDYGTMLTTRGGKRSPLRPLLVHRYYNTDTIDWDDETGKEVFKPAQIETDTLAAIMTYGKGKLLVSLVPLMYSNYAMRYCDGTSLALRMVALMGDYPVIRIDPAAKSEVAGVSESPLRYVLSQPAIRWAIWLLIATIVLAMVFTARRRQRVIPVIAPPVNRSLEMVKHIGSLYFHRHDNADLMTKKYQFFVEEVRRLTMIDLDDESHLDDAYLQLQQASGIHRDELRQHLQDIAQATVTPVKDKQLMRHIDYLNHLLSKLK